MRKFILAFLAVLTVATVTGVSLASDPNGHLATAQGLLDQAQSEIDAAIAEPPQTITQTATVTQTVTATPPPTSPPPPTTTTATPPSCVGVQVAAGANLKTAMDAAPPGTIFCLGPGTFTIPTTITVKDGTLVVGAGRTSTFIVGAGAQNLFTAVTGAIWEFRSLDISGAVGTAACSPECGRAFIGNGESLTITDVRCHNNDNQCVGSGAADLHFVNNECDHNGTPEFAAAANRSTACIKRIRGASTAIVTEVRNSFIHDNIWSGVWFDFYEGTAILEGNTITGNGKAAIQWEVSGGFNAADNIIIRGNTIQNNGRSGITTTNGGFICNTCADVLIENNTFGQNGAPSSATTYILSTREWGNIHGVIVRNNALNGDALTCPTGVTCSGNN